MAQKGTVRLSAMDVARAAYEAGFRGDALVTAVAVAKAESGYMRDVISATNDYGLWQINGPSHPSYNTTRLLNEPLYNAQAAFTISSQGKNWNPWYTYKPVGGLAGTGPYRNHLTEAANAVNTFLGWSGQPASSFVTAPTPVAFASAPAAAPPPPPPPVWRPAEMTFKTQYRQQAFDKRMQVSQGLRKALGNSHFGPTFIGWIEPLKPRNYDPLVQGGSYVRPAGYGGPAPSVPHWQIFRGDITQTGSNGGYVDVSAPIQAVHFLFNPNEISMGWTANPQLLPIGALDEAQVRPDLPMSDPTNTLSFALYFDRTYEVCDGNKIGAYLDVRQLEQITGITPEQPVMRSYPVKIFFGKPDEMRLNALISNMDVTYTHFSHEMVPMRATVSITARRLSSVHYYANEETAKFWGEGYEERVLKGEVPKGVTGVNSLGPAK